MNNATLNTPVDRWAFGTSIIRMENGAIRDATEAEILAESKSSPAAMVRVLGTGADLLRFDANGHYSEDVTHIRALETQEGKSAEEISAEVRQAVEDLRNKMRADIEKGVFSVNDAGQVFYQPEPSYEGENVTAVQVAPESIGFEMNSLLIESITKKVSELTKLGEELADVLAWSTENPDRTLFEGYLIAGRTGGGLDMVGGIYGEAENIPILDSLPVYFPETDRKFAYDGDIDRFFEEASVFSEAAGEGYTNDPDYVASLIDKYARLLGVSPGVDDWRLPHESNTIVEFLNVSLEGPYPADTLTSFNIIVRASRLSIDDVELQVSQEKVRNKTKTLSDLAAQVATNFKVDNARFNNILEAINSYNKAVMDTLRRFSII